MLNQTLIPEFKREAASTKKMLERIPEESFAWKPHEKSFALGRLAGHVAELTDWVTMILTNDELDFAKGHYKPFFPGSKTELLDLFQKSYDDALKQLEKADDATLMGNWTLRNGEHVIVTLPRMAALRSTVMNHFIHHRGQLTVYLRLLDIPVPGMYGPSKDEM